MQPDHSEELQFYVLAQQQLSFVLGLPWLRLHNPVKDWQAVAVCSWSPAGNKHCTSDSVWLNINIARPTLYGQVESRNAASSVCIPKEYHLFADIFSTTPVKPLISRFMLPASAGFFLVEKRDGGLRSCTDSPANPIGYRTASFHMVGPAEHVQPCACPSRRRMENGF